MRNRRKRHNERELRYLSAALEWARARGYVGDRLPLGRKEDSSTCPLGLATGWVIGSPFAVSVTLPHTLEELPRDVASFVRLFDFNRYPELVQK